MGRAENYKFKVTFPTNGISDSIIEMLNEFSSSEKSWMLTYSRQTSHGLATFVELQCRKLDAHIESVFLELPKETSAEMLAIIYNSSVSMKFWIDFDSSSFNDLQITFTTSNVVKADRFRKYLSALGFEKSKEVNKWKFMLTESVSSP